MVSDQTKKKHAINELSTPTNTKTLKLFLGAIQYLAKFIPNLSEKTDNMRRLQKKRTKWGWTEEQNTDLNNLVKRTNDTTLSTTLQRKQRQRRQNRRLKYRSGNSFMVTTKQRRIKTNRFCQQILE